MTNTALCTRISTLPKSTQDEIFDFTEFLIQKNKIKLSNIHHKTDCMKGVFTMKDDFNEPLDDFNK